ncbi:ligase-associated DNA damage response DEXH box helicase [Ferruginibacter albus]|uniref:ligase-associated DNA damage response DEXH box helicase n=1 Tax=Ferruginibacter albus TaxID=2875540 RepID=UPI001CC5A0B8|nr:ligase-associated DNA damage response DEXH box helicase [Ferruginibacter albus]UAY50637.1 ligase-associated DNA damage response DEXH box helicase [Ferruginibacter albus]
MQLQKSEGYKIIHEWLLSKGLSAFPFQEKTWQHIINHQSGLVNAPTGFGKTYAVFLGALIQFINQYPADYNKRKNNKLQLLWISPLRALAKDVGRAMEETIEALGMNWKVGIRNGDTTVSERQKQQRNIPEILVITPESLHLLLAQKNNAAFFTGLKIIAVDEWHELLGSKRGVQVELAISRIIGQRKILNEINDISVWGISATIGNLTEAKDVLVSSLNKEGVIIRAALNKRTEISSILPDEIEKYPWAGHLGLKLADKIIPIIKQSNTTLVFINTRGMSERWYQAIVTIAPELSGLVALHHGSMEHEIRTWVEESLHKQKLKAVVCTASLDLGVDFRPVDTVIQVGSPKGVARFLQRAGRSGHQPGETSNIYFLPTHSLELIEAAALKTAIKKNVIESRQPMLLCFDVLIQYLCTLATGDGFIAEQIFNEVKQTYCYKEITEEEWQYLLHNITQGGVALQQYDEFKKVEIENGIYKIKNRAIAMRHRLHIGTIVSEAMLKVKLMNGRYIGVIEEWFISRLEPGAVFTLSGRNLELITIKDMDVIVKQSSSKKTIVPSWQGGRMPLSANLGAMLRKMFDKVAEKKTGKFEEIELEVLKPLFQLQQQLSAIPQANELLIEHIETKDGFHVFVYPFEGRLVHEAMAALLAYRIATIIPITFSIAMNDYGFELLSDKPVPLDDSNVYELFSIDNLLADIQQSVNSVEMAKRKFRDIAVIGGLVFQGYPGEYKKARHLQSSSSLIFSVLSEYEKDSLLLRQAYQEVFDQQMEEVRLRNALQRISSGKIIVRFPGQLTPFCFPIKVDSMRENLTSEKLEERILRMQQQLEKENRK